MIRKFVAKEDKSEYGKDEIKRRIREVKDKADVEEGKRCKGEENPAPCCESKSHLAGIQSEFYT